MSKFVETVTMEKSTYDAMVERERDLRKALFSFRLLITTRELDEIKTAVLDKEALVDWVNANHAMGHLGKYDDVKIKEVTE